MRKLVAAAAGILLLAALVAAVDATSAALENPGGVVVFAGQSAVPANGANGDWHTGIITTKFGCGSDAGTMASGLDTRDSRYPYYAALPTRNALMRNIEVRGPNGKTLQMPVLDVGPFCTADDAYVFNGATPLTVQNQGDIIPNSRCNHHYESTGAALDLSCKAAAALGIGGKGDADWRFV